MKFQISNFKFQILKEGGFTLLEVMIALSIVAGVIITVLASLNYQLHIVNDSRDVVIATILGKKMAEKTAFLSPMEKKKGDFGAEFPQFLWELDLEDTQFKTLKRMNIKVLWGKGRNVSIVSYKIEK
ncbi:MAG: hypothetical protein A2W77_00295 [Nitrospinae bacterium RIFCSPLOWO2_12_39_16]|nr:MAG: hypothetical protein A2W77_00295 [Nitrospinae bacterium RIFCSPLOWO2_12_39_16]